MENTAISNNDAKTELSGFQYYSPSNIVLFEKPSKRSEGIYDILPDITICVQILLLTVSYHFTLHFAAK